MIIVGMHLGRLAIDLILVVIMFATGFYEFSVLLTALIAVRLIAGHLIRIIQFILQDRAEFIAGLIGAFFKTSLEVWGLALIIKSRDIDVSMRVMVAVAILMILRNAFEAISLCQDAIEKYGD